jgi:glycosyltransferase involved in cell wall biosynthesis
MSESANHNVNGIRGRHGDSRKRRTLPVYPNGLNRNLITDSAQRVPEPREDHIAEQVILPQAGVPPAVHGQALNGSDVSVRKPLTVGFVVNTFSFGGSETETIELVYGADPQLVRFSGIAVGTPLPLPLGEPPKDGRFPPIYAAVNPCINATDPRVRIVDTFNEAVKLVIANSDVVITWGLRNLYEYLPSGKIPKVIVHSKDSGDWARGFLHPNSMMTRHYVANSTLAAAAFPEPVKSLVRVIHDGINPLRVVPHQSRAKQRKLWRLTERDKVVGYLGRIERDKGVSKTVEGVARLPSDWKAVFIGLNPNSRYADVLKQHCERAIPGRYRLLPWCHDVGSALAAFDVFCHPSEHEGFSNSIGEAWLAGVPTVYTQDTGAIPDVGELGISVSQDAGGREIADAVLTAHRSRDLVTRAREAIENGYLVTHNVRQWTNYLFEVHEHRENARVLILLPREMANDPSTWLRAFRISAPDLDLTGVVIEGASDPEHAASHEIIYREHFCRYFHAASADDVERLVRRTRPDVIVTFDSPKLQRLMPRNQTVPGIILPNHRDAETIPWDRWGHHLTNVINNYVHAKS